MFVAAALALMLQGTDIPAPPAAPVKSPEEKQICRREIDTGSRLGGKRRCLTAAQWEGEARAQADQLKGQQRYQSRAGN